MVVSSDRCNSPILPTLQSPDEYPLSGTGRWRQLPKLVREAVKEARGRVTSLLPSKKGKRLRILWNKVG